MHLFIEKEMRCGISYIAKRHSKANNKYMGSSDSSEESVYTLFILTQIICMAGQYSIFTIW